MICVERLNGEILYLNWLQVELIEQIPETKIRMMNGDYYLVKRQCRKYQRSGGRVLSKMCQHKKRDADLGGKAGGSYNITRYNPGFCFNCKRNRFC